ncbi:GNAT family N-acetyltransferase [Lacisediminimonas profundi]|uniref:GNAT family N-acetyltransferase n=1 Tax=Lacisediminimonas profundi TaxID=2603856 RepID=UPI00124B2360|nr:GNAT family N-acetyltransferase [Lacisediminimonas profundi]
MESDYLFADAPNAPDATNVLTMKPRAARFHSESETIVTVLQSPVPAFAEAELIRLYNNLYSSIAQFRVHGCLEGAFTFIASQGKEPTSIFLFRIDKHKASVLNNGILVGQKEVRRFADAVFAKFPVVDVISFHAVQTVVADVRRLGFPTQRFNHSEDIVATLPASEQEYLDRLGKSTRKNVRYYTNKVKRDFPSWQYQLVEKGQVSEQHIRDIVQLKRASLARKDAVSPITEADVQLIIALVRECGFVGVATIDGKVCAGSIGYRTGSGIFGSIVAHDARYDQYWIGMLCCYSTIVKGIALGCTEYHFQSGRDEYKYRLLGERRDLDDLTVYRSWGRLLLNGDTALKAALVGYSRKLKTWLIDAANTQAGGSWLLARPIAGYKKLRRICTEAIRRPDSASKSDASANREPTNLA